MENKCKKTLVQNIKSVKISTKFTKEVFVYMFSVRCS